MDEREIERPPPPPSLGWKAMDLAPKSGAGHRQPYAYGPYVWLRAGRRRAWARWRSGVSVLDRLTGARTSTPGRWEDTQGDPIPFEPEAWSA